MSDLTRQDKLDIAAATALTLVSWVAFWLFGFEAAVRETFAGFRVDSPPAS